MCVCVCRCTSIYIYGYTLMEAHHNPSHLPHPPQKKKTKQKTFYTPMALYQCKFSGWVWGNVIILDWNLSNNSFWMFIQTHFICHYYQCSYVSTFVYVSGHIFFSIKPNQAEGTFSKLFFYSSSNNISNIQMRLESPCAASISASLGSILWCSWKF